MNITKNIEPAAKSWRIPVTWEMCGYVWVSAPSLAEAMEIAKDPDGQMSDGRLWAKETAK